MENYIKAYCEFYDHPFDELIQQYNSNIKTRYWIINRFINYKIKNNKDVIYKEDIPKIFNVSQEKFTEKVMKDIREHNIDTNNLNYGDCSTDHLWFYYISTFLDNEPVDIKIALKD